MVVGLRFRTRMTSDSLLSLRATTVAKADSADIHGYLLWWVARAIWYRGFGHEKGVGRLLIIPAMNCGHFKGRLLTDYFFL